MLDQLGTDLFEQVVGYLDPIDVASLTLVNHSWSQRTKEYINTRNLRVPSVRELVKFLALEEGTPYHRLSNIGLNKLVDELYRWSDHSYAWLMSCFPRHPNIRPVMSSYRARIYFGLTPKDLQDLPSAGTCRCFFRRPFQVRGLDSLTGFAFFKHGKVFITK